jgi:hypothetical protein
MRHHRSAFAVALSIAAIAATAASCAEHLPRQVTQIPRPRITSESHRLIAEMERCTGLKWKGQTLRIILRESDYQDANGHCWRSEGPHLIGARTLGDRHQETCFFACPGGEVPQPIARHEMLHVLLLSHGITGHPPEYARCAPFWKDANENLLADGE